MQIFYFFWIILTVAVWVNAIAIMIRGEVEIKSRFLWVTYKLRFLRDKPAYLYAICHIIGSSIMLSALSLYPVFGIDSGYFGSMFCGSGIVFFMIAAAIAQKYETVH